MRLKTLRVGRFKKGLQQPSHLKNFRGRIRTLEIREGHQLDRVSAWTIIGPGWKGIIADVEVARLSKFPDIARTIATVVLKIQGESGAEVRLRHDLRNGGWRRCPIQDATAHTAILHEGQFSFHVFDLRERYPHRRRQVAGTARSQIAKVPRKISAVVGLHRAEIKRGRPRGAIKSRHLQDGVDRCEDVIHRRAGVCTRPTGVGHQGHGIRSGFRKRVAGVRQIGRVGRDTRHPEIPMEEGRVHRKLLEINGLANAQLATILDGHIRADVRVTHRHIELKVAVRRAEQDPIPPFLDTNSNDILPCRRGLSSDEPRHRVNLKCGIGVQWVRGRIPRRPIHIGVRRAIGWVGGRLIGRAPKHGGAKGVSQAVAVRICRAVVKKEVESRAQGHWRQAVPNGTAVGLLRLVGPWNLGGEGRPGVIRIVEVDDGRIPATALVTQSVPAWRFANVDHLLVDSLLHTH